MITRITRTVAVMAALLLGLLAVAGSVVAQDSTPAAEQPVMVGETEIAWTGDWTYDASSSMDQQATLTQVDAANGSIKLATYGEFEDESVENPGDALDTFATAFFEGAGADMVVEAGSGELENGAVWKIYSFNLQGLQLSFLATVSETADGAYVVTTLTGNTDQFSATIEQAQEEIMLNGESIYLDGVDAMQVTSGLNATPVATPGS